jgi:TolB-like protein
MRCLALAIPVLVSLALPAVAHGQAADARPTVAVIQFNNSSLVNHAEYEPLSRGMADLVATTLRGNTAIRVVERGALDAVLREQDLGKEGRIDDATAARIGRILGARYLIKGTFFVEPRGRVRITAHAVNSTTGEIEHSDAANGTTEDLLAVIDQLSANFSKGLKLGELPLPRRNNEGAQPGRWAAVLAYSRAVDADSRGNVPNALALYNEFLNNPLSLTYAVEQRKEAEKRVRVLTGGT